MKFKLVVLYLGLSLDYSEIFYSEEDHGRPLLPASATVDMITGAYCKFTEMNWSFQNVTPRKGRELS